MKYASAALSLAVLASPAAAQEATLSLNLLCPGEYSDTETTRAVASVDGESVTARSNREVMRPGTARIFFREGGGEFIFPDGRVRALEGVTATETQIRAEYTARPLLIPIKWRVEIDRMTGGIRVANGMGLAFVGMCEAAPTTAKF